MRPYPRAFLQDAKAVTKFGLPGDVTSWESPVTRTRSYILSSECTP